MVAAPVARIAESSGSVASSGGWTKRRSPVCKEYSGTDAAAATNAKMNMRRQEATTPFGCERESLSPSVKAA
jgi:hypothetical protein